MFKPIYKEKQLLLGDLKSPVGIVSLWTERKKVAREIDGCRYAAIGQLYSAARGLDPLIRNLLANPTIRCLVVCGRDLSKSGQVLADFFKNGVREGESSQGVPCWQVISGAALGCLDIEISKEAVDLIRREIRLVQVNELTSLKSRLMELEKENFKPSSEHNKPLTFPKKEVSLDVYPAEESAFVVRGRRVADTWIQILDTIVRFGKVSKTHYDSHQKEILDLVSVVSEEDPDNLYVPEYLPCDAAKLEDYFPRVLTDKKYPDCSYTYGQRLHSYFGGIDQIQAMIKRLSGDQDTRSAAASLWDPVKDSTVKSGSPCLNHLWARIRENRLFLTATIRSNDMFSAWPENAFALRKLQQKIQKGVEKAASISLKLGDLIIVSQSAHIYEDCWEPAANIVDNNFHREVKPSFRDPRGAFVIEVENEITVTHLSPEGEVLHTFRGKSARELNKQLKKVAPNCSHALYLGGELAKAELALKYPGQFQYIQDKPLIIKE